MTDFTRGLDRRTFIFGAAALGAATLLRPTLAFAEPTSADKFAEADSVRARINEMQEQLTIPVRTITKRSTSTKRPSKPLPTPRRASTKRTPRSPSCRTS